MNEPHLRNIVDAELKKSIALPASTGTVNSASVDLGVNPHVAGAELRINAPALDATELPNTETTTYTVQGSNDDSSWTAVATVGTQTGADSAGADAATYRYAPPSNGYRYYRISAASSASAGDQSGSSVEIEVVV